MTLLIPFCERHNTPLVLITWNEMTTQYYCPRCQEEVFTWVREPYDKN